MWAFPQKYVEADVPDRQVIESAIARWAKDLIDLGRRNRLIYLDAARDSALDLTPSGFADPLVVQNLLDGQRIRLSDCFPEDRLAGATRRARAIRRRANWQSEETGLSTLHIGLGAVSWRTEDGPGPAAPLLLAAAELIPRGRLSDDFDLEIIDFWEPNVSLLHLLRSGYGVNVPEGELSELLETIDPAAHADSVFQTASAYLGRLCAELPGFSVEYNVVLSNFSYAKLPMVRDLESSLEAISAHPLVAALAGDEDSKAQIRNSQGTNGDIGYDEEIPPHEEFLVLDADRSQSAVINAAIGGRNLAVVGPPGTGKSQTIANLIATLAARGKSILFVAEKRAAIEAVTRRLIAVGLGDLVLDLHTGPRDRRHTYRQLAAALETARSGTRPIDTEESDRRLVHNRDRLNTAADSLHRPVAPWGLTAYEVQGELLNFPTSDRTSRRITAKALRELVGEAHESARSDLRDYVNLYRRFINPESPWYAAYDAKTIQTPEQVTATIDAIDQLLATDLPTLRDKTHSLADEIGFSPPATVQEAHKLIDHSNRLRDAAGALEEASSHFTEDIHNHDLAALREALAPLEKSRLGRLSAALFDERYRDARSAVRRALRSELEDGQRSLDLLDRLMQAQGTFVEATQPHREVVQADAATMASIDPEPAALALATVESLLRIVAEAAVVDNPQLMVWSTLNELLTHLEEESAVLRSLPSLSGLALSLHRAGLGSFTDVSTDIDRDRDWDGESAVRAFEYSRFSGVYRHILNQAPDIATFDAGNHDAILREFAAVDRASIDSNAERILRGWAEEVVHVREQYKGESAWIDYEAKKKHRHTPIRRLFREAPNVLTKLKPCWAMSPLIVAQLLPNDKPPFDVVIFDEASQIPPADAIPALLRASQTIVAGDPHQLPPTTFFTLTASDYEDEREEDRPSDGPPTRDLESILDAVSTLLPVSHGKRTLTWHYRSRDERLIAFANHYIYDRQLVTFPGALPDDCIEHVEIPRSRDSMYDQASNTAEVRRVVSLIFEHAKQRERESLGVIALGLRHADRIDEALRVARRDRPELDGFFNEGRAEPFFVKNLEPVQGDERDAIIFSVGYGRSPDGKVPNRFGPVASSGGYRRLNVAITRAKRRMTVVSAFGPDDLDPDRFRNPGVQMLRDYLMYASSRGRNIRHRDAQKPPLNPFEVDIRNRLTAAGIPIESQYGASGYLIDFVAFHPSRTAQPVLAIEADGYSYYGSQVARDRDRLRQDHLERLGWRFHRIWSTEWFRNPDREVERCFQAWRDAVSEPPTYRGVGRVHHVSEQSPGYDERGPRPPVGPRRRSIERYSQEELIAVVQWVKADGKLRTTQELADEVVKELGFHRAGARIKAAVGTAIERAKGVGV